MVLFVACLTCNRGIDFRPAYGQIATLRSLVRCPWLLITATCTLNMCNTILNTLGLDGETTIIGIAPDRPNIYLSIQNVSDSYEEHLKWYMDMLRENGPKTPKAIVYCHSFAVASQIFQHMTINLGDQAFVPNQPRSAKSRLISMFTSNIGSEMKDFTISDFTNTQSTIRLLISTIAFGMGVQIPNVRYVLHWGPSKSILSYWQEVGRCSRDNEPGEAYLYVYPGSRDSRRVDEEMLSLCRQVTNNLDCVRLMVLKHFQMPTMDNSGVTHLASREQCDKNCTSCKCVHCKCCCVCRTKCKCRFPSAMAVANKVIL